MLKLLLGDPNARKLKRFQPIVSDINLLEEEIAPLSDDELRGLTAEFRQKLEQVAGQAAKERANSDRRAWRTASVTVVERRAASSFAMACTCGSLMFMPIATHAPQGAR